MLENTRGILLRQVKYAETSVIATIYTEEHGRQSYLINGVRNKNATIKASVLQPLYLLDLEVYHKPGKELNRLKSARIAVPYISIPYDIQKSTLVMFLSEVLYKCLREEEPNADLFDFLFHSFTFLDLTENGTGNFHLWFLYRLTAFLGILPNRGNMEISQFFDLRKAVFVSSEPGHPQFMDKHTTILFARFFDASLSNIHEIALTQHDRQTLLRKVIEFYQIHFDFFGDIKSLSVLKEVFI